MCYRHLKLFSNCFNMGTHKEREYYRVWFSYGCGMKIYGYLSHYIQIMLFWNILFYFHMNKKYGYRNENNDKIHKIHKIHSGERKAE